MRRCRSDSADGVNLNVTAMLDMAFQLLAFFVLTFKAPAPEGQLSLRLPPPARAAQAVEATPSPFDVVVGRPGQLETLVLTVARSPGGATEYGLGDRRLPGLAALESALRRLFADPGQAFRQVLLSVDGDVPYEQVLAVVETCVQQKLPGGARLDKLSLAERVPGG